jgi:hypothetical protein
MPGLEISIITAKFKTKAEEPQISRFFSKLLETGNENHGWRAQRVSFRASPALL